MVSPTRTAKPRRWYLNLLWAVAGGVATVSIGVTTNVISYQLTEGAVTVAPNDGDAACPELPTFDEADGTERVTVLVRDPFAECWNDTLDSVRPGDEFEMRVEYQNNTAVQQNDIMLRAVLPDGFEYIDGSSLKASSSTGGGYLEWNDDIVRASAGLNGGDYRPRGNVFIKFKLRMTEALAPLCGVQAWAPGVRVVTANRPDGMLASAGVMTVRPPCE